MAKEILYRRGYLLSFMPAPIPGRGGSGLHINLSFRDRAGKNAFGGGTEKGRLSPLVKGCIAGLLHHHEALGGLLAPTVNSYARLKPANLCGYWANWGYDHRATAVRVSAESGSGARIEHRVADCAASPYVAVAAALQAARLGFVSNQEPPPEERGDGLETISTDRHVAHSLAESLDHLEKDTALTDAVGSLLVRNFIAIKRSEIKEVEGKSEEDLFHYYLPFI
jgi:glutamine synthetase